MSALLSLNERETYLSPYSSDYQYIYFQVKA